MRLHSQRPFSTGSRATPSGRSLAQQGVVAPARAARRPVVLARATAEGVEEMEQIDPRTGMPMSRSSVTAVIAGNSVKVGGFQWAYRRTEPDATKVSPSKPSVVLVHGLGSSSYCYRNTLGLLGGEGYDAVAPDWVGHGDSDKPDSGFDFSEAAYKEALGGFIASLKIKEPFALVVHGFILGQYAMLYAQEHPDKIDRLLVLNTPVAKNSKLRPELAAYKNPLPFLRPGNKKFEGDMYNANGSSYVMSRSDADVYNKAYVDSPAATAAIAKTMDKVDFPQLLKKVDEGFMSWRKPTALVFGSSDTLLDVGSPFDFLESKRTNMKAMSIAAKVGHMPQEDYAEILHEQVMLFLTGSPDDWSKVQNKSYKMTKKGAQMN